MSPSEPHVVSEPSELDVYRENQRLADEVARLTERVKMAEGRNREAVILAAIEVARLRRLLADVAVSGVENASLKKSVVIKIARVLWDEVQRVAEGKNA